MQQTFQFISWPNFLEGYQIFSPEIWGKTFNDWFKKCSNRYILCNLTIHRMGNASNLNLSVILSLYCC